MPQPRMHRRHGADVLGPGTDRGGEHPGLEIGAEMALRIKHEVEAGVVGRAQHVLGEL